MSTLQEFASASTLFGGNAPYIEEQYERYLADPAEVPGEWRAYFDSLRDGAADVAHAPIVQSFIELARNRKVAGAMVDATTMHKQVLVLRLISKFRTLGMFHADLDPLQRQEKPVHRRSRPRELRLHAGGPRHRFRRRLVQGRRRPDAARRPHRRAAGYVLPHVRRRVHVHLGHADQALRPAAAGADSRAARRIPRPSSGTSWSG
jgi:2-oxoglutarate dehydrogenase complex dehydrogenase (E1) component-like enzyme